MKRFTRSLVVAAMLLACVAVGCTQQPPPAPAAPVPTQLVIHAQKGQTQAQQNRDNVDCQSAASAQATSSFDWSRIFGSCMGARGYLVQ
jgi:Flp pilus assembly protein TadD